MKKEQFYALFAIILITGTFIRFYDLTLRPIHHDEGVIGWFRLNIYNACMNPKAADISRVMSVCGNSYTYDPEYHGPFPLIAGAWVYAFFGVGDYTLRAPGCLFSALTVVLLLLIRKELGDAGTLVSASVLAVSPSMAYYSQFAYSDDFFIFFSLGAVVLSVKFLKDRRDLWLCLLAADLGFLSAVKEAWLILLFSGITFFAAWAFFRLCQRRRRKNAEKYPAMTPEKIRRIVLPLLLFLAVYVFFYSNMFTNPGSLWKGIANGLSFWVSRSTTWVGHFKPFDYYIKILWQYETAAVVLSLAALLCLRTTFYKWCAWWAASTLLVYSLIPYKTPWLDINLILPIALLSGAFPEYCASRLQGWKKYLPALVVIPLLLYSLATAWSLTYVRYADPGNSLAYAATPDSYNTMIEDVEKISTKFSGHSTRISVKVTDYWPLPWSLREYILQYGGGQASEPIVLSERPDYSDIALQMRDRYSPPARYEIRQGVYVYLYAWKEDYTNPGRATM